MAQQRERGAHLLLLLLVRELVFEALAGELVVEALAGELVVEALAGELVVEALAGELVVEALAGELVVELAKERQQAVEAVEAAQLFLEQAGVPQVLVVVQREGAQEDSRRSFYSEDTTS